MNGGKILPLQKTVKVQLQVQFLQRRGFRQGIHPITSLEGFAYQLIDHTKSGELTFNRPNAIARWGFWQDASDLKSLTIPHKKD
jgi:hypothetical protein